MRNHAIAVVCLFFILNAAFVASASEIDDMIAKWQNEQSINITQKPVQPVQQSITFDQQRMVDSAPVTSALTNEELEIMKQMKPAEGRGDIALVNELNAKLAQVQSGKTQEIASVPSGIPRIELGPVQVSNPLKSGVEPLWHDFEDFPVNTVGALNPSMAVRPSNGDLWVIVQNQDEPTTDLVGYVTPDNGRTWWWMFTAYWGNMTEPSALITNGFDGENLHIVFKMDKKSIGYWNFSLSNWPAWRADIIESSSYDLESPKITTINSDYYYSPWLIAAYTRYDPVGGVYVNASIERSTDGGFTWTRTEDFSDATGGKIDITYANKTAYVAYDHVYTAPPYDKEIYLRNSTTWGYSWSTISYLAVSTRDEYDPSVAATLGGQDVIVAYTDRVIGNDSDIRYAYSNNKGYTWSGYRTLANSNYDENSVDLAVDPYQGKVHAAYTWYYRVNYSWAYHDSLFSFSQPQTISNYYAFNRPSIAVNPDKLPDGAAIAWSDFRDYWTNGYKYSVYFDAAYLQPYSTLIVDNTFPYCTSGNGTYSSIQSAVSAAANWDTVLVCPGTYAENVDVSKNIYIRSYTQNPADTKVIALDPAKNIFNVNSATVEISGFNITNASVPGKMGVYLFNSANSNIRNNWFINDYHGVNILSSNGVTVYNNTIRGSYEAIQSHLSDSNYIAQNDLSRNTIGVTVSSSNYSDVGYNKMFDNSYGVMLNKERYVYVYENKINRSSFDGINLQNSQNNTIYSNIVNRSARYGIYMDPLSNGNVIYNNYYDNSNNARDLGTNMWNITKTFGWGWNNIIGGPNWAGNYWSDYNGVDLTADGLGDTLLPYNSNGLILNGGDFLPLTKGGFCIDYDASWWTLPQDPPINGDWDVSHRIVCNDAKIVLNGNLNIYDTGNLTFNNVTLLMNVTKMGEYSINVNGGNFTIDSRNGAGSLITNGMNTSVFYTFKVNRGSTFKMRNSTVKYAGTGYVLLDYSNDGIWIDADGVILDNNTFTQNNFDGLYLNRSDNSKITNNRIYSNRWNGIRGITVNNLVVTGSEIYLNGWTGIALDTSANGNVSKNNVHNNSYDGISMGYAPNAVINNNTISFNSNDGIDIRSSSGVNVKFNNVFNNAYFGITLGSSPLSSIIQNTVNNNSEGIYISDSLKVLSDKNTVINNRWYGIHLYLSHSNILSRNIVNQTNKELASSAVYLSNSTFSTINDNGVYENLNGIQLWYSPDATISNNKVSLTKGDLKSTALYLSNSARGKLTANNVSDNWDGIVLWESPNALLTNNMMLSNSNNGIKLQNSGISDITNNYARSNGAGISVISSNNVNVIKNIAIQGSSGISISSSSYGGINDNIASNNGYGIALGSSNYHDLNNNTARNNAYGISLSSSSNNNITNSSADLNNFGLYMAWSSNNNRVVYNNFSSSPNYGGFVFKSNYNNISENNLQKSGMGLHLEESNNNDLLHNDARSSTNYGIDLYISNNNNISRNDARYSKNVGVGLSSSNGNGINDTLAEGNSMGVSLRWSNNNVIMNNTARSDDIGIYLFNSGGNDLIANNASNNNNEGIELSSSSGNHVNDNTASGNAQYGIHGYSSATNDLINNTVESNGVGVYLDWSTSNNILQNRINLNKLNGLVLSYVSDSNTVLDNTINTNGNISAKISSSKNNTIENNSAMYSDIGIFLDWSKNNFIRRNMVNNNDIHGISLEWYSDNNIIADNKASNNIVGLSFMWSGNNIAENNMMTQNNVSTNIEWSSNNNIVQNNIMRSNNYGVSVGWSSQNNTLTGNWIDSNARLGLYLRDSDNNKIYNNYIANSDNVWDNGANIWNISKTTGMNIIGGPYLGGNYWSDYSGKDLDGDRLGDTRLPYNNNITVGGDYHPLTLLESALPLVYVAPDYQKASAGSNFTVTIEVNPLGNNVYAVSYNLSFDPARLEALTQTKGPFMTRDGANSTVIINNIDNTNGMLSYAETRVGTLSGTNIADTITTVKFRVKSGSGNTSLTIIQAELTDPTPDVIPTITKNGLVDIGGSQPVANCGPDKLKCENVGTPVQFDGSASYDPDGSIVNYAWNFGDGTTGSGVSPTHKYTTYNWNGTAYTPFTVMLTVTDNSGLMNTDTQLVTIWITGDATGDGRVNIIDAATIGLKWGSADPCADLNNDGKTNIVDAAIVGLNWGRTA